MNKETITEHAERLLELGKRKLTGAKSSEGRKAIRNTNKYLKQVIKLGRDN